MGWRREFEQQTSRMHQNLVLQDMRSAIPQGNEQALAALSKLIGRWLQNGVLHAGPTLQSQQKLQEATAGSRNAAPESFRKSCWHGALNNLLQIRAGFGKLETL